MQNSPVTERGFRFLMIMIFLAAAIETDIYLPSFPDIMTAFNTDEIMVQRILSFNFLGVCIASLFYGPASDAFGRKRVLNVGYFLFVLASFGCTIAPNIEVLIALRFIQGFGSAACFIIGTAVIFDLFKAEKAAKMCADLSTLVVSLIAFAPMLGGWINIQFNYHYNFLFIAVLSLVTALICYFYLPESLPEEKRQPLKVGQVARNYLTVLKNGSFWANTLICGMIFGSYMVFVSSMSLVFINHFGIDKEVFPLFQFGILASFVLASINASRLMERVGLKTLRNVGFGISLLANLALYMLPDIWQENAYVVTGLMAIFGVGAGLCGGIFFSASMEACPEHTGISSSLVTSIRLALVAVLVDISSKYFDGTLASVFTVMTACMAFSLVVFVLHERSKSTADFVEAET
ncbi:multidrug effflux MFS transporter [Veronia pacifica]|uniref:Bcr/CflA family efflux transporter n=1 Tax=Veronia pacifica TaxID=1080227 RepID=A0A1C3EIP6_9GAMM|nr:multidrug effflux MFS transporter [Veronia pacifica]ODA33105.1 Bcr/CflA family drug resistance efflux transporter [Veronia pacifica]